MEAPWDNTRSVWNPISGQYELAIFTVDWDNGYYGFVPIGANYGGDGRWSWKGPGSGRPVLRDRGQAWEGSEADGVLSRYQNQRTQSPSPEQIAINEAVAGAMLILSGDNPCSQAFGFWLDPSGRRDVRPALRALGAKFQPGIIDPTNRTTGIRLSQFNTNVVAGNLEYRLPDSATVNRQGPFYNRSRFGSFESTSLEGRTLAILHELAHIVRIGAFTDPSGRRINMYLIPPNDFGTESTELSQQNTATIERACGAQIRAVSVLRALTNLRLR